MPKTKTTQPTWIANLRTLMEARNLNPRSLSLQAGLNPTAVRDMLEGRTRFPRYDTALSLSDCLGVTPAQLMGAPIPVKPEKVKAKTVAAPVQIQQQAATHPPVDDDLELLTEIITRLHELTQEYSHELEARDFAAMTATIYRQINAGKTRNEQDVKPRLVDLMEYESLRRNKAR